MVRRIYVEKKPGLRQEARGLLHELQTVVGVSALEDLRLLNRYDVEGLDEAAFRRAVGTVFSEPQVDDTAAALPAGDCIAFGVEPLPGQFDQRADSAAQCIQLMTQEERPTVRTARIYLLFGPLTAADVDAVKRYVLNPVECREASLDLPERLAAETAVPADVETVTGFTALDRADLDTLLARLGLAMDLEDLSFLQAYFRDTERRDPTLTEIRVGNVANAVLSGLQNSRFEHLTCYTEVVQDSMLDLIRSGKVDFASTTALSPSPEALEKFLGEVDFFKDKILLRPQEISNSPEVARRLGVIAMNTAIEMDIYGNVNSTHIMGSSMMNGIGGSGDFSRNAAITIFSAPSTAKGGKISSVVPMVSHVDHTEHEVMVLVTEQGFADLRGLSPKERAVKIIQNCAHPDFKDALMDYFERACEGNPSHTPHILNEALSWHIRFQKTGSMSV